MLNNQELNTVFNLQVHDSATEVFIFSRNQSPRLTFTLDFIFKQIGLPYRLVSEEQVFLNAAGPKINYSDKVIEMVINILPSGLLDTRGITEFQPAVQCNQDTFRLFTNEGEYGFDVFSAVFYMISRYEEWQGFADDRHGRFEAAQSILFKNNVHLKPVTDIWIRDLKERLSGSFPPIVISNRRFRTIATLDIDNLYAYKHKGLVRTAGAFAKDLLNGNFKNARKRLNVIQGKENDPFDVYSEITHYCKEHSIPLVCFFLMATGTEYDRSVDPNSEAFTEVFSYLEQQGVSIGIHPSYFSEEKRLLPREIAHIQCRIKQTVIFSRQHYLRYNIRTTPGYLMSCGITHDFTMGFASAPGFRAGTSFPFHYYDFHKEAATPLLLVPFCAMDGAYMVYGDSDKDKAYQSLIALRKEVEKVNGFFITVFHERTFCNEIASGFGEMYKALLGSSRL